MVIPSVNDCGIRDAGARALLAMVQTHPVVTSVVYDR